MLYLHTTTCIYSTNRKRASSGFKAPLVCEFNSRSGLIKVISRTTNETKASAHMQAVLACFASPPLSLLPSLPLLLFLFPSFMADVWFFFFFASVLSSASKWLETICDPPDSDSLLALPQSAFGIIAGWCLFDSLIVICFDLRLLCLCLGLKQWEIRTLDWGCKHRERTNAFFVVFLSSLLLFYHKSCKSFFVFCLLVTRCALKAPQKASLRGLLWARAVMILSCCIHKKVALLTF